MPDPLESAITLASGGSVTMSPADMKKARDTLQRFVLEYRFALREIETKIAILREEFQHMHDYNPIEHVTSRVKSFESILDKAVRKGIGSHPSDLRASIMDIAGVRVTCSFTTDVYRLFGLLTQQDDVVVREVKDYISQPKPNGYKSLHAIVEIPVFLSTGTVRVPVELQFRTIAMDFWASLEHKIFYKFDSQVPAHILTELKDAADSAAALDHRMESLHSELHGAAGTQ